MTSRSTKLIIDKNHESEGDEVSSGLRDSYLSSAAESVVIVILSRVSLVSTLSQTSQSLWLTLSCSRENNWEGCELCTRYHFSSIYSILDSLDRPHSTLTTTSSLLRKSNIHLSSLHLVNTPNHCKILCKERKKWNGKYGFVNNVDLKRYVLMWSSICRNMQNLQMKIINLSLGPLQRMPREKSMLYSVTFSSINAQFCNIAFSQMVYCPNWCSYYIPFHLTFIHKLSFSQRMKVGLSYLYSSCQLRSSLLSVHILALAESSWDCQSRLWWHVRYSAVLL